MVENEEDVYSFTNANNGAGPMWCHGSTCLVRSGKHLFASGLETVPEAKPLNNCRWMLFERKPNGWEQVCLDMDGRTREPAPMAAFADGRIFLSVNPTLSKDPEPNGGPARPDVLQFKASDAKSFPELLRPVWQGDPKFTEHSYRSFAADGRLGELIFFQNIGYTHAEWTFRDRHNKWSAQGQLKWPWGAEYDKPEPIRVCYPNVAIRNRAVYFFGVSDVVEPYKAWREFKRELTGQQWDYASAVFFIPGHLTLRNSPLPNGWRLPVATKLAGGCHREIFTRPRMATCICYGRSARWMSACGRSSSQTPNKVTP